ncbi:uncharacterized protein LOC106174378 [Lingula anatina]|uniref:Uncharacterized protein LOC106174378 n=1 Tax=Lingula anatina TaxID=7574 RepID=A0A1S3JLT6_LINAN|nr:uncharacterized protein LOC106174378 [Lingula anatina]|eukprot:XP_013411375.1 uncharacterized protein LOC106174378 [Lingula anatina]
MTHEKMPYDYRDQDHVYAPVVTSQPFYQIDGPPVVVRGEKAPENGLCLALCVCCCFNCPFGVVALCLSYLSSMEFKLGSVDKAKMYGKMSLAMSITGIIVLAVTAILVSSVWGFCSWIVEMRCPGLIRFAYVQNETVDSCPALYSFANQHCYRYH